MEHNSQDVLKHAARLLRIVAEGGTASTTYFWAVTLATEAFRDGNVHDMEVFLNQADQEEES
jgi:hypothetical protein